MVANNRIERLDPEAIHRFFSARSYRAALDLLYSIVHSDVCERFASHVRNSVGTTPAGFYEADPATAEREFAMFFDMEICDAIKRAARLDDDVNRMLRTLHVFLLGDVAYDDSSVYAAAFAVSTTYSVGYAAFG